MTDNVVWLDGDAHESALCEKRGQFQQVCGCGWRSSRTTDAAAAIEHDVHVAGEKLWARLTEPQRAVLDVLVASDQRRAVIRGRRTDADVGYVNGVSARSLAALGMVRIGGIAVTLRERGWDVHPLARCSVRDGGRPCGYCHACRRRLPALESMSCPSCGASDWDE